MCVILMLGEVETGRSLLSLARQLSLSAEPYVPVRKPVSKTYPSEWLLGITPEVNIWAPCVCAVCVHAHTQYIHTNAHQKINND